MPPLPIVGGGGIKHTCNEVLHHSLTQTQARSLHKFTAGRGGAVVSPGFVARRGKARNYVMEHSRRTSGPARCSSCSMTNSFVTNAVLIEGPASCWHLHQLILNTTQYLDSWPPDLLQSELKTKLL